jgi:hypothetical protein
MAFSTTFAKTFATFTTSRHDLICLNVSEKEEDGLMNVKIKTRLTTVFIVETCKYIDWFIKQTKTHVVHWSVNDDISGPIIHS